MKLFNLLPLSFTILLLSGCGTAFVYSPKHDAIYTSSFPKADAIIFEGTDERVQKERKPRWKRPAEIIVASALADELNYSKLFGRVKVDLSSDLTAKEDSMVEGIAIHVKKLRLYNPANAGEIAGGAALGLLGIPGVFIAASIPTKFVADAEVNFAVFRPTGIEPLLPAFSKSYSAHEEREQNAYAGMKPLKRMASDTLEAVVKQFVRDLSSFGFTTNTVDASVLGTGL